MQFFMTNITDILGVKCLRQLNEALEKLPPADVLNFEKNRIRVEKARNKTRKAKDLESDSNVMTCI